MAIPLTINGQTFEYPVDFDETWGVQATGWAQAVTNGMLQRAGGNFPLTADADFGGSFGLVSLYYKSHTASIAATGVVRLAKTDAISWRNNAGGGDLPLAINGSDQLTFNGVAIAPGTVTSITGTAHQIIASASIGAVTLSAPQNIDTTSSPTFASLTLTSPLSATNGGTGVTSLGNLTDAGTDGIVVTGGTGALITSASIAQHVADASHNGYLSSTDWTTFNNKVTSITGTANEIIVGGTATVPILSTPQPIGTASSPTFGGLTLTGLLSSNSNVTTTGQLGIQLSGGFSSGAVIQSGTGVGRFTQWSLNMALSPGGGNGHGIGDYSAWAGAVGTAYASIETQASTTGSANYDHIAGFQANNSHGSSGTLTNLYGFISVPVNNGGVVANMYGYVSDPTATNSATILHHFHAKDEPGSVIGSQVGFYAEALTVGSVNKFAFYAAGTANPSFFAGGVYCNETPPASAIMSAASTTQGFLPPRMTTTQRDAISSPAEGLMVYNTSTHHPNYYNGTSWVQL